MTPAWFVVQGGDEDGRAHLRGWMKSAIELEWGRYLAFSVCPRCHTMVLADDKHAYGDREWAHERWHAETDWPIPDEVLAKVTRP